MAQLNPELAAATARKALVFLNSENFRNANWRDEAPWGQRQDLAYALDLLEQLAAMTLNLADRTKTLASEIKLEPGDEVDCIFDGIVQADGEIWIHSLDMGLRQDFVNVLMTHNAKLRGRAL